jgi:hypothetical protein
MKTDKQSASFLVTAGRSLIGRGCRAIPHAPMRLGGSFALLLLLALVGSARAQVNSGSDGHDGPFNPTASSTVINMADHPNGIYQYTSVNIPTGVTVSFIPNANNTPVVWLVQSDCVIQGTVDLSGKPQVNGTGGIGGPGGYRGGNGGNNPTAGLGPGGGPPGSIADSAAYGTAGYHSTPNGPAASTYGTQFILPLLAGSGGGGGGGLGGGGGGGAILIAASNIVLNGSISANGADGSSSGLDRSSGAGSGGGIRFCANVFQGRGSVSAAGGSFVAPGWNVNTSGHGGEGRIRIDCIDYQFGGSINSLYTRGFQPIIIPAPGQGIQLAIASVGGVAVAANPSGVLVTPDAIIAGQQTNPIAIVVHCSNLPLNTPITVSVRPVYGSSVSAVGYNNTGTQASSTATVSLNIPRGGGILYATAATGN